MCSVQDFDLGLNISMRCTHKRDGKTQPSDDEAPKAICTEQVACVG